MAFELWFAVWIVGKFEDGPSDSSYKSAQPALT